MLISQRWTIKEEKEKNMSYQYNLMSILTSFNSPCIPASSARKPDEPSPIPPIFSTWIDVSKNFAKADATWLEDSIYSQVMLK